MFVSSATKPLCKRIIFFITWHPFTIDRRMEEDQNMFAKFVASLLRFHSYCESMKRLTLKDWSIISNMQNVRPLKSPQQNQNQVHQLRQVCLKYRKRYKVFHFIKLRTIVRIYCSMLASFNITLIKEFKI